MGELFISDNPPSRSIPNHDEIASFESKIKPRLSWDEYFLEIADTTSKRATCNRKKVGTVLVRDHMVLAGGYNGSLRGMPHCDEVGHLMENDHCIRTIHAEENAVAQAAKVGVSLEGATAYIKAFPCWLCFRLLAQVGIVRIVYSEEYRPDPKVLVACKGMGITLDKVSNER